MSNIERYGPAELECGLLWETRDGPGGRVSLLDHRGRSTTDPGEVGRLGSCWRGVGLDPVGLRACMLFRHWGAIPRKFVGRMTDSCRSGPRWCWETGTRLCRTLQSGWAAGAHHRWFPRCPELGNMGGGCGLPEGIGGLHRE